ncbi:MAG: sigma-70 family RNA polymerase sigma factor [Phycisphaerae bacterium]
MSEEQDAADVGRVLAGDVEAFAGIVRRWQGPLVTLAFRFCRDRGRAEEMAQTAFLKAYQSLGQWRGGGRFSNWLFAVAANVYCSEIRRQSLVMFSLDAARDVIEAGSTIACGAGVEREERVRRAVSMLPGKYRDVLVLFYFHEMDVRETAMSLGIAEGTVKARLHRGRALVRRMIGPGLAEPTSREELE